MKEPVEHTGALYDVAPCGLATITRRGEVMSINETMRDWLGIEGIPTVPFHQLLRPGDRIYWETHVAPLLDMQHRVEEIAMELRHGSVELPILLNAVKRSEASGALIDLAIFKAVDRRSYERELLAARRRAEESEKRARQLARSLQESLIPPLPPVVTGLGVGATYRPAGEGDEVGGDFYDVFQVGADHWLAVVGDVCGKGVEAAALTSLLRHTIRGAAMETPDLDRVVADVNTVLLRERTDRTATVLMARVGLEDAERPAVTVCSAGHPLPRLVDRDGSVTRLGSFGTLLGAFERVRTHSQDLALASGSSLVMFTDGVTDARRRDEFFGEARLDDLIVNGRDSDPAELASDIASAVMAFQAGPPKDDIAVVVLKNEQD